SRSRVPNFELNSVWRMQMVDRKKLKFGAFVMVSLLGAAVLGAQAPQAGKVDFSQNVIEVQGLGQPPTGQRGPEGYPLARRSAQTDAFRQMAETTRGVQIDSRTVNEMGKLVSDRVVAAVTTWTRTCQIM